MRTRSIAKLTAGFFLVPLAVGSAGYYFVRPMVDSQKDAPKAIEKAGSEETISKRFATPEVKVNKQHAVTRRRGTLIGKRPRRAKPKVEEKAEGPTSTPISTPSIPDIGDGGGTVSPDNGGTAPDGG